MARARRHAGRRRPPEVRRHPRDDGGEVMVLAALEGFVATWLLLKALLWLTDKL
jgi:hypothetical protein